MVRSFLCYLAQPLHSTQTQVIALSIWYIVAQHLNSRNAWSHPKFWTTNVTFTSYIVADACWSLHSHFLQRK